MEMTRKYSKLKLVVALRARGLWDHAKDWMVANGVYDLFVNAQDMDPSNGDFQAGVCRIQSELGISGDLLVEILAESEADGV